MPKILNVKRSLTTISANGIAVTDCGDYFRVLYDAGEISTIRKSAYGFQADIELLVYLSASESLEG